MPDWIKLPTGGYAEMPVKRGEVLEFVAPPAVENGDGTADSDKNEPFDPGPLPESDGELTAPYRERPNLAGLLDDIVKHINRFIGLVVHG